MDIFRPPAVPASGVAVPASGVAVPASGVAVPASGVALSASGVALPASGMDKRAKMSSILRTETEPFANCRYA